MLQFAKRLLHKNITITLIITKHLAKTTQLLSNTGVSLETISDGFDDGIPPGTPPEVYLNRFKEIGPSDLKDAVHGLADSGRRADCVVYDPFLSWGLEVAKELGLAAAAFFTQSCAVDHIYHHLYKGDLKVPLAEKEMVLIPGLPPLEPRDMPSFVSDYGSYPRVFESVGILPNRRPKNPPLSGPPCKAVHRTFWKKVKSHHLNRIPRIQQPSYLKILIRSESTLTGGGEL